MQINLDVPQRLDTIPYQQIIGFNDKLLRMDIKNDDESINCYDLGIDMDDGGVFLFAEEEEELFVLPAHTMVQRLIFSK